MSRARDLSRLSNPTNFTVDVPNSRVGLGSTVPTTKLAVDGTVTATAFLGDGSGLEGVASAGLGTAIDSDTLGLDVIYYTNRVLHIPGTVTVDVPDTADVAYTQYTELAVESGADFIVADGDDFVPDILGIGTEVQSPGLLAGGGGRVRTDNITNKSGDGAPTFQKGVVVTGVATATSFSGTATTATNLADAANITTGTIADARFPATLPAVSGENLTNLPASGDSNDITACLFI
tara:strand:- start:49 stop:753 length:705 start_codon:yes stop_codon:yes gene_type:complete